MQIATTAGYICYKWYLGAGYNIFIWMMWW